MEFSSKQKTCLKDLYMVGPKKPLGYLPISTIENECDVDLLNIKADLESKGLKTILLNGDDSDIASGALYAYHEESLNKHLNKHALVLTKEEWPTEPELFIRHLKNTAPSETDLFNIIADAFGDTENPGRKV